MNQIKTAHIRSYGQKSLIALGMAALTVTLLVAAAKAHALLIKSEPNNDAVLDQTPNQINAWFSQELETKLSSMQVFDPQGNQVDSGDGSVDLNDPDHASMLVSVSESLPKGSYTVHWTAVSADDGDITEGEFSFDVTNRSAHAASALESAPSSVANESELPLGELIIATGVLLLIMTALLLYPRLSQER
ncbi:MAG: copper resistance protein CopC [Anaerolineae bacterium]|nr:copper resistance protein CopC [Anaerolineae bacterium]